MGNRLSVLLTTEGTYPFHHGGVSNWGHQLIEQMPDIDFTVYSVVVNPYVTQKFSLRSNASLIRVPLWGTEEPSEHLGIPFSAIYFSKFRTKQDVIEKRFLPLFKNLVLELLSKKKDPDHFAKTLIELYRFFKEFDFKISFKSKATWEMYKEIITQAVMQTKTEAREPDVYSLIQSLGWIYRFFTVLNTPVPQTDVAHSSAAAFCGIPAVISKITYGTPYLLTEHGVYLREQYLSLTKRGYPSFLNTFLIRMIQSVVTLNYSFADQISPVCEFNTRWEKRFMPEGKNIEVIYNGIDYNLFKEVHTQSQLRPTAITVARIDPLKDILTLIEAAAIVKKEIPDVQFIIYGSVSVEEYYLQCLELRTRLGLEQTVIFAGHVDNIPAALQSGKFVIQSSISEGFPYAVIEAMMAGKAVISTDVGGIKEALEDTGILIAPKDINALATACIRLFKHPELREELAQLAKERALTLFTLPNTIGKYYKSYIKLALGIGLDRRLTVPHKNQSVKAPILPLARITLSMEKGFALLYSGLIREAIEQFQNALRIGPSKLVRTYLVEVIKSIQKRQQQLLAERAYSLIFFNQLPLALVQLKEAVEISPNSLSSHLYMSELEQLNLSIHNLEESKYWKFRVQQFNETTKKEQLRATAEKGYALANAGYFLEASKQLQHAMGILPNSPAVPILMAEMASFLEQAKEEAHASLTWEKFYALKSVSTF